MEIEESFTLGKKMLSIFMDRMSPKEDFRFRMLQENRVEYLLPMQRLYEEGKVRYFFDTTERTSFATVVKGSRLGREVIKEFTVQLFEALVNGMEYYLEEDSFVLSPDYIYLDAAHKQYFFCYCPDYKEPVREQVSGIIMYLMDQVDYEDPEAVKLVYQLRQMVKEDYFSAGKLLTYVREYAPGIKQTGRQTIIKTSTPQLREEMKEAKVQQLQSSGPVPPVMQQPQPLKQPGLMPQPLKQPELIKQSQPVRQIPQASPVKEATSVGQTPVYMNQDNSCIVREEDSRKETGETVKKGTIVMILSAAFFLLLFCIGYAAGIFYTRIAHLLDMRKVLAFIGIVCVVEAYISWTMFGKHKKESQDATKEKPVKDRKEPLPVKEAGVEPVCYHLIPCQGEAAAPILVNQFPFAVGKDESLVNSVISNPKISRVHAVFTREGDGLYLNDSHSLNGTYVNQSRLLPASRCRLQPGDYIGFANLVYQLAV